MKGILMKPPMVKAIMEGRKTTTMRISGLKEINKEPDNYSDPVRAVRDIHPIKAGDFMFDNNGSFILARPRYQPGEVVYIKESCCTQCRDNRWGLKACYKDNIKYPDCVRLKWKSPLFMPAWATRTFITIKEVGVMRVQEIKPEECVAEGVKSYTLARGVLSDNPPDTRWSFIELWDSINKPPYDWNSNPWVFRYRFELKPEE